jgi:hypothetical protein
MGVKINKGGNLGDSFAFAPALTPAAGNFSLTGAADHGDRREQRRPSRSSAMSAPAATPRRSRWRRRGAGYADRHHLPLHAGFQRLLHRADDGQRDHAGGGDHKDLAKGSVNLKVHLYEWVKCWYTNTLDTGTIKAKVLAPATDAGRFDHWSMAPSRPQVGDGGATGPDRLPGTHTVGGAAGTATDLANYTDASCTDTAHERCPTRTAASVDAGDAWDA